MKPMNNHWICPSGWEIGQYLRETAMVEVDRMNTQFPDQTWGTTDAVEIWVEGRGYQRDKDFLWVVRLK